MGSEYTMFTTYLHDLRSLMTGGSVEPAWTSDGTACGFVDGPPDARAAWRVELATGTKRQLVDVERARIAIRQSTGVTPQGRGLPFGSFTFSGGDEIRFEVDGSTLTLDLATYEISLPRAPHLVDDLHGLSERARKAPRRYTRSSRFVNPGQSWEVPSPDGAFLLSNDNHNVVVRSTVDGRAVRLTDDGVADHEWRFVAPSLAATVAGTSGSGACWSPDSRRVAAYKVDLRDVYLAPQVHYLKRQDEVVYRHRAQAGGVLERTTLHVLDLHGRRSVEIDLGDTTDSYPVTAAWSPDSSHVLVFTMSRDCTHATVLIADAATGRARTLFSEADTSFVRIQTDVYSQPGAPKLGLWMVPDGRHIIWLSERSGWRHFYLYDLDGHLVRPLTTGQWPVDDLVAIRDGYIYFTGRKDQARPYDLHFYRVPLDGGEVTTLTERTGVHTVTLAPTGTAFLDTHSAVSRSPVVDLRATDGRLLAELSRADISQLETMGYQTPEEFTTTAADGETQLWGVMFKPGDFDPAKKYPLIEIIYGGPQTASVPHGFVQGESFEFAVIAQALAQLGYVTVMVDARGTPCRSKQFHDASYRRFANTVSNDHAETIRQLASRHTYIDDTRVGIFGHSWGGYFAFRCLAERPEIYAAGVCLAPAFDPYASVLYECYLDLPQKNPSGYAFAEVFPLASKVEGALMLAAGTSDQGCWSDAVKMSEALIRAGKLHDFVPLPEAYHGLDSIHEAYFWRKAIGFFACHLNRPDLPAPVWGSSGGIA